MAEVYRFAHEAMATTFEVLIARKPVDYARQVAIQLFREIDRLEALLSRFRPDSEIAMINRLAPGESLPVSIECFEVLQLAARVHAATSGAFDISYQRGQALASGMERLALLREEGSGGFGAGRLPDASGDDGPGLCLDLGAIGKGYALDSLRDLLNDWDVEDALLHSGTSTALAIGNMDEEVGWTLGAGGMWAEDTNLQSVRLHDCAISGSGTEVKGAHILDPRTGKPAAGQLGTWVIAPTAAESDALSTAFFVMSPSEVKAYCEAHPTIAAMVAPSGGDEGLIRFGRWPALFH